MFENFFSKEQPKADNIETIRKESVEELKIKENNKGIIEWIGKNKGLRNITILLSLLSSTEAFAQKGGLEESIESAKKAVGEIESVVKKDPDSKGKIKTLGENETEFFEKSVGNKKIHTNDHYLYIKEVVKKETGVSTRYGVDIGKDGSVDEIVVVPGEINNVDEAMIVTGFSNETKKGLEVEADLASMEKDMGDKAALHRVVFFKDPTSNEWVEVNFDNSGSNKIEKEKGDTLQKWWEAQSTITAAELNQ